MAIDKILPKNLNADAEERILPQGTMTDAMNVTISENGEGTASVVKDVKGTIPGDALSSIDSVLNNHNIKAIGSASDSQRGFIYYIVADSLAGISSSEHAIYQYNVTNDTYRVILKDSRLNFDPASFVKVDVVNGDFTRSGGLQTVLFFTDNINPPRKINVDRAISGAYSDISQREFDYSLNCIKAPNVYEPKALFTSDTNIDTNLFRDESFQFATQIIYKDGEESAISPYSKLTIPTQLTVHNVGEIGYGLSANVDNVCIVNPNLNAEDLLSSPDISKLRILFRVGNMGAFNIADELPLNIPTNRFVNGTSVTVFDGSSHFRFYNDRVVAPAAPSEVNKLFDNVPFQAKGQAVSGNRLMYSNYTEGRENTPASATLTVKYKKSSVARADLIDQTDSEFDETGEADIVTTSITTQSVNGGAGITVKLKEAFGLEDATAGELESFLIEAGTVVKMRVEAPMNLPQGLEMPVGFDFTAKHYGDFYKEDGTEAVECPVHISSIELHTLDQQQTINPVNSGVNESPYYPLNQDGTLNIPTIDLQIIIANDVPFMSSNDNEQDFFSMFVAELENTNFQGTYYAKIKGTQGVMSNVKKRDYTAYNPDGGSWTYTDHPIFYSVEQPLGDTTANGDVLDLVTPPYPIFWNGVPNVIGDAAVAGPQSLRTPYQPTDYSTIVTNPITGTYDQFNDYTLLGGGADTDPYILTNEFTSDLNYGRYLAPVWQKEGAGAVDINFELRVSANPITGTISADIVPFSFQPYSGGKLPYSSATGSPSSDDSGLASGLLLVTYPHWTNDASQVADAQPIPFTVPDIIPIEWPEGEAMNINGGFLNNTVSGVDVPVPFGGSALQAVYPEIEFGLGCTVLNNLTSSGALLQQIEDLLVFSPSSLLEKELSAVTSNQVSGFKAGAMHNFGVVYYDKFNRSGFVNEIGNTYVEWFNKDGDDFRGDKTDPANYLNGPAAIEVKINNDPPTWAETYQIVYPGNANVSDFVQYTIGGCYPARVKHDLAVVGESDSYSALPARDIDTQSKRLYVSLETLDQYRTDKNTRKDYSYTEGDKLRVISFKNEIAASISVDTDEDDLDSIYKGASDGTIIEFDVVGVEMLAKDIHNPIAHLPGGDDPLPTLSDIPDYMTGRFLVLEASSIEGGAFGENGEILKFPGFDWNHVSAYYRVTTATQSTGELNAEDFDYLASGDNAPTPVNSWRQRSLVEILTPKLSTENEFYYEVGERKHIGKYEPAFPYNDHGPAFILDSGDINYRPVPCKTLFFNEDAGEASDSFKSDFKDFVYKTETVESFTVSDKLSEKMWSKGRPHVKYDSAATFRRFNGVTYSDAYAEDVDRLSLSSFNGTLANFYSLDSQYGACNYISNYGSEQRGFDELLSIQENKFSKTPVNKSIITDAAGSNNVALSTSVLSTTTYYTGDYGCGDHPESVLVQDNDVYFFDRSRKKVLRFSGNQLNPISDNGVSSIINDATDAFNQVFNRKSGKIISGYNPDDNVYYITFQFPSGIQSYSSEEDLPSLVPLYYTHDLNQDGSVNSNDLLAFLATLGTEVSLVDTGFAPSELLPEAPWLLLQNAVSTDFDDSSLVNVADMIEFMTGFGSGVAGGSTIELVGTEVSNLTNLGTTNYFQFVNPEAFGPNNAPVQITYNGALVFFKPDATLASGELVYANGEPIDGGNPLLEIPEEVVESVELNNELYKDFVTLSYNAGGNGFWQSKNSYYPDIYASQDNKMYTVKYVPTAESDSALMFHRHEDLEQENSEGVMEIVNRSKFYNQPTSPSFVEVVFNAKPSAVKVFDALSFEANYGKFNAEIISSLGEDEGNSTIGGFIKKEGSYYSAIGGDESANSTSQIRPLGSVINQVGGVAGDGSEVVIHQHPNGVTRGTLVQRATTTGLQNIGQNDTPVFIVGDVVSQEGTSNAIVSLSDNVEVAANAVLVMVFPNDTYGDSIRGHYAKVKLSTVEGVDTGGYELFCVNAHVTPSDLHHIN